MGKKRIRASAVCEAEGHLLLVHLRDPTSKTDAFYPPGGGIEDGESPVDAARRETKEETGVEVTIAPNLELIDHYPFHWDGVDYDCTTHYFAAQLVGKFDPSLPPVVDAAYNEGAAWMPVDEALEKLAVHPRIATSVARVLGRAKRWAWRTAPGFGGDAQMLLMVHDHFRTGTERLRLTLEREPELDLGWMARLFHPLSEMLHHHHHLEEIAVFPQLARSAQLVEDHDALKVAIEAVEASLKSGASPEAAAKALATFDDILIEHLDREERLLVPVLLKGM